MRSTKSLPSSLNIAALVGAVLVASTCTAQAASSTWSATSGTNAWATSTDWVGSVTPGGTLGSTTNGDTATFNNTAVAQTVTVDSGRNILNITFSGTGAGALGYTFSGGPLVLSSGGTITMNSGSAATFSTAITLEGSSTFSAVSGGNILTFSSAITGVNAGTVLTLTGAGTAGSVISGGLKDAGGGQLSLDKEGTTSWQLTGSNTYTGSTTVNGGSLLVGATATGSNTNINSTSSVTIGASGIIAFDGTNGTTFTNNIADSGLVEGNEGGTAVTNTLSGNISGTGGFSQINAGTTILTGSNSYGGATLITNGTLQIGNGTTGLISSSSVVTDGSSTNGTTLALDLATGSTFTNNISTSTDTNAVVKAIQSGTLTISGLISGSGGLTQAGAGTTILTNTNTYTGTTTVSSGELQLSGSGLLGAITDALTVNGGTLDLNGTSQTVGLLTGTGGTIIGTGQTSTLTIGNGTTFLGNNTTLPTSGTYAGVIANNNTVTGISLIKAGNAQETLTGSNTYSGQTLLQGGELDAVDGTGLPTGSLLNLNGGIFGSSGTGASSFVRILGTTPGNVEIIGGESGFSATLGSMTVSLGGTNSPTPITWGQATFNPSVLVLNSSLATGTLSFENALALGSSSRTILTATNTANFDGALTSTGGGLNKIGAGTLNLTNTNNTYSGGTAVAGGVLSVASNSSIGSGGATVAPLGELRLNNTSNVVSGQTVVVNSGGTLGIASNGFGQGSPFTGSTNLATLIDPSSSGILAIDVTHASGNFTNTLDMSQLGNGAMFLGSSIGTSSATGGVYSGGSVTTATGGSAPTAAPPNGIAIFGATYRLGGGGGWLTITGLNALTDQPSAFLGTNLSNALFTQGNGNSPSTPVTYAATSNTRNSVQVGQYGASGAGTLDLANNQSYTGITTVNPGSTLVLDFSDTLATPVSLTGTNTNILNPGNEVDLAGGTLNIFGNTTKAASQTLSSIGVLNGGTDTITATDNGGNLTVNLGALTTSPISVLSAPAASATTNPLGDTGASLLIQQVGTGGTTTIETTTASATVDGTYGGQVVYKSSSGAYTWASGTSIGGGLYSIGAYTADTANVLPTSAASFAKDYVMNGTTVVASSETINLLHITGGNLSVSALGPQLVINGGGILYTATTNAQLGLGGTSLGQFLMSGTTPTGGFALGAGGFNFLNITNDGTGNVAIGGTGSGNGPFENNGLTQLVVVLAGTGTFSENVTGNAGSSYTGGNILDGITINLGGSSSMGPGLTTINQGTTLKEGGGSSSGINNTLNPWAFNGNFTLGSAGTNLSGATVDTYQLGGTTVATTDILNNNIVITVNGGGGLSPWAVGSVVDGGKGYGITIDYLSGAAFNFNGTDTFTGPINLENGGSNGLGNIGFVAGSLNRNNVLNIGPEIQANVTGANSLAGLNDIGLGSPTEIIAGVGALTLWGSGNYSFGGNISTNAINMNGTGTQTLTGSNATSGAVAVNAGTLFLDGSKGGSIGATPSAATNTLTVAGGTFAFKGTTAGSTQKVASITDGVGGGTITVDNNGGTAGATILNLGALTLSAGGTLDVVATNSVTSTAPTITTTSVNLAGTGTLGSTAGHVLYTAPNGAVSWATGTTINGTGTFAIGAYTLDTTALVTSGGGATAANDYLLTASQTQAAAATASLLRITNTTAGSLNLAGQSLSIANNGVLFNGTASYSITDTGGGSFLDTNTADKELVINNYGTGTGTSLTISAPITNNGANINALVISGPGTTVLTGSNTYGGTTYLNNGTINFNKLANFGTGAGITISGATLQYATGNTQDMSSGTVASGGSGKTITINDSGATIDTNGNSMTYASTFGTGSGGVTFVDSASSHGTLNFNGSSGYTGFTTIGSGANVNLGGAGTFIAGTNALSGTIVANGGTLSGGETQVTNNVQGTGAMAGRITLQSGGVLAPGNLTALAATGANGGKSIQGAGVGDGSGNQNQSGVGNNVLNATSLTWNAGGQLKFFLDSTSQQGTILAPSASTLLNLGTGALVKGNGTGGYVLNFQNTGAYNTTPTAGQDFTNVYDLINFGVTNTYGVIAGNTTFNIDDFSIVNLDGVGTLSFYYNAAGDNGAGQEELLLTVVPEPSTWAMLLGGLVALVFWTRKRSRKATFRKS